MGISSSKIGKGVLAKKKQNRGFVIHSEIYNLYPSWNIPAKLFPFESWKFIYLMLHNTPQSWLIQGMVDTDT